MSSCDLNLAAVSAEVEDRMLNMGNKICRHTIDQNDGVKLLPWVLSVSNKQSSALEVRSESRMVENTYSRLTSKSSPVMMIS